MEIVRKEINFNDVNLTGIFKEGKIYIIIKNFCEILGVNFNGQLQRIKRDEVLSKGVCKIHIPSEGGTQETNLLDHEFLPMWLTGIKVNQCREEVKSFLLIFKLKAKDILSDAFFGKRKVVQEKVKHNIDLNLIDDRVEIIRELEEQKRQINLKLAYLYTRINYTSKSMIDELKREYKKSLESKITVEGKELTTEEVDALDTLVIARLKDELEN